MVSRRRVPFKEAMKIAAKAGPQADLLLGWPLAFVVGCWWTIVGVPEPRVSAEGASSDGQASE